MPTQTPVPSRKVGLGSTLADWERVQGAPSRVQGSLKHYQNDRLLLIHVAGNLSHVEKSYGDPGVPIAQAKTDAAALYPDDAVFVRTYTARSGNPVDLFKSSSLVRALPDEKWTGGEPGNFIVIYRNQGTGGRVTSIVVGAGNNP